MENTQKSRYQIVLLPGDGIGVEVCEQGRLLLAEVAKGIGVDFDLKQIECGGKYYLEHGTRDWPEGSEEACAAADAILLGAVGWPSEQGGPVTMSNGKMAGYSPVIGNRVRLDLFANVRPVKLLPGVKHQVSGAFSQVWKPENVDMVIVRENTEGLYTGMGGYLKRGDVNTVATDTRIITRESSERIIRHAFEISANRKKGAPADGKKRVTCIVKNNVLDGCRLFAEVFSEVAKDYPNIETELAIVDAFTQWLVTQPEHYDVCVTTNMFGDIVTDLASVLQGGMGMAVGCNVGHDHGMFEPIHGSAPPLAGKDSANPLATILAVGEMLDWLGGRFSDPRLTKAAKAIFASVSAVTQLGTPLTEDLVGKEHAKPMSVVGAAIRERVATALA